MHAWKPWTAYASLLRYSLQTFYSYHFISIPVFVNVEVCEPNFELSHCFDPLLHLTLDPGHRHLKLISSWLKWGIKMLHTKFNLSVNTAFSHHIYLYQRLSETCLKVDASMAEGPRGPRRSGELKLNHRDKIYIWKFISENTPNKKLLL